MSDPIPFIDLKTQQLRIREAVEEGFRAVLDSGQYIMGPAVKELESELSRYCGAAHTVSCSSGTDAVWLPLLAWEIGAGDAVFIPSFTFAATAEAVALCGATPVFVDVDRHSFVMDPRSLEQAVEATLREGTLRPRAIIPVDLFGIPAPYGMIRDIAQRHGLKVLADAAQAFGGIYDGARVGTLADATATSFFPAKPLGCYGDGGAIFTDDEETQEKLVSIRIHGRGVGGKYDNIRVGTNARLDTLQAVVLREKLKIFDDELDARQRIASRYSEGLEDGVQVPVVPPNCLSAWAQYTIVVEAGHRDELRAALKEQGVPTNVYYPAPLHTQPPYQAFPVAPDGLPNTEALCHEVLSLPMHPYLKESVQDRIINAVREGLGKLRARRAA